MPATTCQKDVKTDPKVKLVGLLLRYSENPVSLDDLAAKKQMKPFDDNEIKIVAWKLAALGLAEFDEDWNFCIPVKNANKVKELTSDTFAI